MKKVILTILTITGLYYPLILMIKNVNWLNSFLLRYGWTDRDRTHYRNVYDHFREQLAKADVNLSGKTVLEVGSGNASFLGECFLRGSGVKQYVASDFYRRVKGERHRGNSETAVLDITQPDLDHSSQYDAIISNAVLEHIPKEKMGTVFRNFDRLLREGGYLVHQIDFRDHINKTHPFLNLRFDPDQWERFVQGTIFYTNRLRVSDYVHVARKYGFEPLFVERRTYDDRLANGWEVDAYMADMLYDLWAFVIFKKGQ